ncbi:MAG TPA: PQQ-binding-like beta-propeller repeat protein [Terriglobia bacterium]|nr:PQQ-binding-like beta-propeller repeat protein [Terriglobia bacterium]
MIRRPSILILFLTAMFVATSTSANDWPTFGHDPQRSGWAFEEDTLAPGNVSGLELKWKSKVENEPKSLTALTAPVVASKVTTPSGIKTLVYVAGSGNHFFALDAADGKVIWKRDFESHVLPKDEGMWLCPNGINATPTIDRSTNTIYAIAVDGKLYGLDLGTGEINFGPVQFVPAFSKNWSLNLVGGVIYTTISQGCGGAQSGIYSMDVRDRMHPVLRHLLVSKGGGAGIWGRGGTTIGKNGRAYSSTGDGAFDPGQGVYGSTVIAASLGKLKVVDYYTPTNFSDVTKFDLDMGASSPVWFAHKNYNLLAVGGKEGTLYLLDADELGSKDHQTPFYSGRLTNDDRSFQEQGIWGGLAAWRDEADQSWVYVPAWGRVSARAPKFAASNGPVTHGSLMAFKVSLDGPGNKPILKPAWISRDLDVPEPPVIANGVVFVLSTGENREQTTGDKVMFSHQRLLTDAERAANTHHAVLYALDARSGKVLFDSGNAMTTWVHFSGLAVANGRVFAVDHDSQLYCFGLKDK